MALTARVKTRAQRQIEAAAAWWARNRSAAPGAIRHDLHAALEALVQQPGIGTRVENAVDPTTRRLYLARTRYFVYYRQSGLILDVVAFWHASRGCRAGDPQLLSRPMPLPHALEMPGQPVHQIALMIRQRMPRHLGMLRRERANHLGR